MPIDIGTALTALPRVKGPSVGRGLLCGSR